MSDLSQTQVVLIIFAMPGCPACEDYMPRFERQVVGFQRFGAPFVYHRARRAIPRGAIPIAIYDATSDDQELQALADQYGVTGMPTTMLVTRYQGMQKHEGTLDDDEIYRLLMAAAQANR